MLAIRSKRTVVCALPFTRKHISGGDTVQEPFARKEARGNLSDEDVRAWLASVGATQAEVNLWGSYNKQRPGVFDLHTVSLGKRSVKL